MMAGNSFTQKKILPAEGSFPKTSLHKAWNARNSCAREDVHQRGAGIKMIRFRRDKRDSIIAVLTDILCKGNSKNTDPNNDYVLRHALIYFCSLRLQS
jgi:hypothetical protein